MTCLSGEDEDDEDIDKASEQVLKQKSPHPESGCGLFAFAGL
jgi:hypothetical protein